MKKLVTTFFGVLLFSLIVFSTSTASTDSLANIAVGKINLEKLRYKNTDYAWYVARLPVENNSEQPGTVSIHLKSIDKYAYQRNKIRMSGHVEPGHVGNITLLSFMDYNTFGDIKRWEVERIEVH